MKRGVQQMTSPNSKSIERKRRATDRDGQRQKKVLFSQQAERTTSSLPVGRAWDMIRMHPALPFIVCETDHSVNQPTIYEEKNRSYPIIGRE